MEEKEKGKGKKIRNLFLKKKRKTEISKKNVLFFFPLNFRSFTSFAASDKFNLV